MIKIKLLNIPMVRSINSFVKVGSDTD